MVAVIRQRVLAETPWLDATDDNKPVTWVTPHTSRKTVATLIKEATDTKIAAAQLGHSSEEVTATYYIATPAQAPDVSDILERLGTDHGRRQRHAPALPNDAHG
ncbi:hypothetical protein [Micromonospora sp. NBC_00617]|uniref:hypothetical protein n=1 Tax=Micromonospora sp. NBC_00617 TaxID=2903587 RepID=UPI0030DEE04D